MSDITTRPRRFFLLSNGVTVGCFNEPLDGWDPLAYHFDPAVADRGSSLGAAGASQRRCDARRSASSSSSVPVPVPSALIIEPSGACWTCVDQYGRRRQGSTAFAVRAMRSRLAATLAFRNAHHPRPFICRALAPKMLSCHVNVRTVRWRTPEGLRANTPRSAARIARRGTNDCVVIESDGWLLVEADDGLAEVRVSPNGFFGRATVLAPLADADGVEMKAKLLARIGYGASDEENALERVAARSDESAEEEEEEEGASAEEEEEGGGESARLERRQRKRVERRRRRALRAPAVDAWPFKYARLERRFVVPRGWKQRGSSSTASTGEEDSILEEENGVETDDADEATTQLELWASVGRVAPCVAPGLELLQHMPIKSEADIGYAALMELGAEAEEEHRVFGRCLSPSSSLPPLASGRGRGRGQSEKGETHGEEEETGDDDERHLAIELFSDGSRKGGVVSASASSAEREAPLLTQSSGAMQWTASVEGADFSMLCDAALSIATALGRGGSSRNRRGVNGDFASVEQASEWSAWSRREAAADEAAAAAATAATSDHRSGSSAPSPRASPPPSPTPRRRDAPSPLRPTTSSPDSVLSYTWTNRELELPTRGNSHGVSVIAESMAAEADFHVLLLPANNGKKGRSRAEAKAKADDDVNVVVFVRIAADDSCLRLSNEHTFVHTFAAPSNIVPDPRFAERLGFGFGAASSAATSASAGVPLSERDVLRREAGARRRRWLSEREYAVDAVPRIVRCSDRRLDGIDTATTSTAKGVQSDGYPLEHLARHARSLRESAVAALKKLRNSRASRENAEMGKAKALAADLKRLAKRLGPEGEMMVNVPGCGRFVLRCDGRAQVRARLTSPPPFILLPLLSLSSSLTHSHPSFSLQVTFADGTIFRTDPLPRTHCDIIMRDGSLISARFERASLSPDTAVNSAVLPDTVRPYFIAALEWVEWFDATPTQRSATQRWRRTLNGAVKAQLRRCVLHFSLSFSLSFSLCSLSLLSFVLSLSLLHTLNTHTIYICGAVCVAA